MEKTTTDKIEEIMTTYLQYATFILVFTAVSMYVTKTLKNYISWIQLKYNLYIVQIKVKFSYIYVISLHCLVC